MVDEKLSILLHGAKLSIHSRSSKGSALYLINITEDGRLERCGGVYQRDTNFECDPEDGVNRVLVS